MSGPLINQSVSVIPTQECSLALLGGGLLSVSGGVATKIFEGFGEVLFMEFIKGQEPVSSVHYTRPGTCINRPLH